MIDWKVQKNTRKQIKREASQRRERISANEECSKGVPLKSDCGKFDSINEKVGCARPANRATGKTAAQSSKIEAAATPRTNSARNNVWRPPISTTSPLRPIVGSSICPTVRGVGKRASDCGSVPLRWLIIMTVAIWLPMPAGSASTALAAMTAPALSLSAAAAPIADVRNRASHQYGDSDSDGDRGVGVGRWRRTRTRLRKRHSNNLYLHDHLHASATDLEWENPCGGLYDPPATPSHSASRERASRIPVKHYLKQLRRSARSEAIALNAMGAISTSDLRKWHLYQHRYKFLPTLKRNSSVALKRWYRNVQKFVAAFAYLGRAQYGRDRSQLNPASSVTHELNGLLLSARRLLCEIETTINGSYAHSAQRKLPAITRDEMDRRLKFITKLMQNGGGGDGGDGGYGGYGGGGTGTPTDVDIKDLMFVKQYYKDYVASIAVILRRNTRRGVQITLSERPSSSASSSWEHDGWRQSLSAVMRDDSAAVASSSSLSSSASESESVSASFERNASRRRSHSRRRQQLSTGRGKSAELTYAF